MFVRCKKRFKDGKEHRYWSVVESTRVGGGRVVQRQLLYLGEINDSQRAEWCRSIEVLSGGAALQQMALFPEDRPAPVLDCDVVQIQLDKLELRDPRQWGACWLALALWDRLGLDRFWGPRLPPSRKGTRWLDILKVQVCYHLIDPGSDWRLHRHWYEHSALRDLLGSDRVISDDKLYRCLDRLLDHKREFFSFLKARWSTLFEARFDVLLYDLTSTYFESDPPLAGKRQFGYSRDKRPDCVQVVIALIITPDGFPLAYEVMPGNTADNTTLAAFIDRIEAQYGRSDRIWIMDRGIPTEETLAEMRASASGLRYLVGTPKGRLTRLESSFLDLPWQQVRQSVDVKLLSRDGELYVLVRSEKRISKERSMRRRRLKKLWKRLHDLQRQSLSRDALLIKLGAAKKEAGRAWYLVRIEVPESNGALAHNGFAFTLRRDKLRAAYRREGRYLLRSNMTSGDPAQLLEPLHAIDRNRAGVQGTQARPRDPADLPSARPPHRSPYLPCLHRLVPAGHPEIPHPPPRPDNWADTPRNPRHILDHTDGRCSCADHRRTYTTSSVPRYTQPNRDHLLLLHHLAMTLPQQPTPRIAI